MKLNIYPKYVEDASKGTGLSKFLRVVGVIHVVLFTLIGATICAPFIVQLVSQLGIMSSDAASGASLLLGLVVGVFAGVWSGIPYFIISDVLDDLNAIRLHSIAYIAFESDDVQFGKIKV